MARQQVRPQPVTENLELRPQAAPCPRISVTDASSSNSDVSASPSPAPSQNSTGRASTPSSQSAPSPQTPASSVYDPGEAVDRAHQFSESMEGSTVVPSVNSSANVDSDPPQSPSSTTSSWRSRVSWKTLVPGNGTQQFLGLGVCALTIVTVVYSHRADQNERWQNGINFYQACVSSNFSLNGCDKYHDVDINPPPYDPWKLFIWKDKRTLEQSSPDQFSKRSIDDLALNDLKIMPAAQERFSTLAGILVLALALLASSMYLSVQARRSKQTKLSEQSMARREPTQPTIPDTREIGANGEMTGSRRFKAYVTAETAIKRLKAANEDNPDGRRGSMPWRSEGLDPALFEDAIVYHDNSEGGDAETAIWEQIKQHRDSCATFSESASTLYLPKVDSKPPFKTPPGLRSRAREEEKLQHLHPLRRMLMPRQIIVSNQPLPELHEGDIKGAIALMGAATAATGGGTAMSMCPVEVPISKHHLPEGWMPISPQDVSCSPG